jgi:hypothetical protein
MPVLTQMSEITAYSCTLTIEEWKAEQQLGGRERAHTSSCQTMRLSFWREREHDSANSQVQHMTAWPGSQLNDRG